MEYQLTGLEEKLIQILHSLKIHRGTTSAILALLEKEQEIVTMLDYISKNPEATEEEIVEMALELSEELHESEDIF